MSDICMNCIDRRIDHLEDELLDIEDKYDTLNCDFTKYRIDKAKEMDKMMAKFDKLEQLVIKMILDNKSCPCTSGAPEGTKKRAEL